MNIWPFKAPKDRSEGKVRSAAQLLAENERRLAELKLKRQKLQEQLTQDLESLLRTKGNS